MFSIPFLFSNSRESERAQYVDVQHDDDDDDDDDSSSGSSSSSDESDSRFMNGPDTSFVALHPHQRVEQLHQPGLPELIEPKSYDDISRVSFDYESNASASIDTSVDLNPYGANEASAHLDIAMRWRRNIDSAKKRDALGSYSNNTSQEDREAFNAYISFQDKLQNFEDGETVTSKASINSIDGNVGRVHMSDVNTGVLAKALKTASASAVGSPTVLLTKSLKSEKTKETEKHIKTEKIILLDAASPPHPPKIRKKIYAGSQFQISPPQIRSKPISDYPLSTANGRFLTKTSPSRGTEKKLDYRLILGSDSTEYLQKEEDRKPAPSVGVGGDGIIVIPVSETEGMTATRVSQILAVDWPTESNAAYATPQSRASERSPMSRSVPSTDAFSSPQPIARGRSPTYKPAGAYLGPKTRAGMYSTPKSRFGYGAATSHAPLGGSFSSGADSDSSARSLPRSDRRSPLCSPICSPCRRSRCSLFNDPSGSPSSLVSKSRETPFMVRLAEKMGKSSPSSNNRSAEKSLEKLRMIELQGGQANTAQGRAHHWMNQMWSPENEEWDWVNESQTQTPVAGKTSSGVNSTLPLSDDEDSLEDLFKGAIDSDGESLVFSPSVMNDSPSLDYSESRIGIAQLSSPSSWNDEKSDSSASSLVYSMSSASAMVSGKNDLEGNLATPIVLRRVRGSFAPPVKLTKVLEQGHGLVAATGNRPTKTSQGWSIFAKATDLNSSRIIEATLGSAYEYETQDRHIAVMMIQASYRGWTGRCQVLKKVST